jgi:NAD(P)-dependent dehydrogenase (short-subunit alcohol dehydrogenase family)
MSEARFDFTGKVAVVTGAANGIGAACARLFAASGASVALWDVDEPAALALAKEIAGATGDASRTCAVRCDVSRRADVDAATAATVAAFGRIDILVNNAGIFRAADFLDITEDDWDAVLGINLKGAFLVGQAVARQMATTGGGAIVNMSSVNGVMAIPSIASYNASKGGINQLTRAMALALADHGIRVNAVAPGTIATELAQRAVLGSAEAKDRILGRTPLRRLGEPSEIAAVCAFLASDAASYMTGEIVAVDGGRLALNYTMPPRPDGVG